MSDAAVTVVWLTEQEPREDAARALSQWARARGLHLTAPTTYVAPAGLDVDMAVADHVEADLERAREAIASLDEDAADRALARAEAALREHAELPQAAWLRAEVERTWAARFLRSNPRDETRARIAWENAAALDGGRAAGLGETPFPKREPVRATFVARDANGRNVVFSVDGTDVDATWDGSGAAAHVELAPGEHQLVVHADGMRVAASWVSIAGSAPVVELRLPDGGRCSAPAFSSVVSDGVTVSARGVVCERWVAVLPIQGASPGFGAPPSPKPLPRSGAVLVARCERDRCGPLLEWRTEPLGGAETIVQERRARPWPAWATWSLVGLGVLGGTTAALVATGVFESRSTETRFVAGGVRIE